ncbi:MAG: glycosyltransferase family 2 protein [Pikeienuella sp.]
MRQPIAFLTMVRGDYTWLRLWLRHHRRYVQDAKSLYVIAHGRDEQIEDMCRDVSLITVPFDATGAHFTRRRLRLMHRMIAGLLGYHRVVAMADVDEMICLDPAIGDDLGAYLDGLNFKDKVLSATGIELMDMGEGESPVDFDHPVLAQRRMGVINSAYCKPCLFFNEIQKGNAHRISNEPRRIDPNISLMHLRYADLQTFRQVGARRAEVAESYKQSGTATIYGWTTDAEDTFRAARSVFKPENARPFEPAHTARLMKRLEAFSNRTGRAGQKKWGFFELPERFGHLV